MKGIEHYIEEFEEKFPFLATAQSVRELLRSSLQAYGEEVRREERDELRKVLDAMFVRHEIGMMLEQEFGWNRAITFLRQRFPALQSPTPEQKADNQNENVK